jgi:hypothetical protein
VNSVTRAAIRVIANLAVLGLVAIAASFGLTRLPGIDHGAIFTAGSILSGALITFSLHVFGKFDKLIEQAETAQFIRTEQIYRYIAIVRRRLFGYIVAALIALVYDASIAYIIQHNGQPSTIVLVLGYVALAIVLLTGIRIGSAYLSLDTFRLEVRRRLETEAQRAEILKSLRPVTALPEIPVDRT